METYRIFDTDYPVIGEVASGEEGKTVPVVDIPIMTDYEWQKSALESRLKYKEKYASLENVDKTIKELREWLNEHKKAYEPRGKTAHKQDP